MSEPRVSSRPIQSCFQCRKRKIKCSKSYPCTPCILRGEGEACREVDKSLVNGHKKSFDRLEELVDRVQKLENSISVLSTRGTASADVSPRSVRRRELSPYSKSPSPSPKRTCSRTIDTPVPSLPGLSTPAEETARMLEDFAMGRKLNKARVTNGFWTSSFGTSSYANESLSLNRVATNHPWSYFVDSSQEVVHRLLCLLPAQAQIQLLLQFYVQRVDWYAKVIHGPTFLGEVNLALSHISGHRYDMINMDFLGLLIMVLCLSFHFADAALCENLFLDHTACVHYARHLYAGAQACLQYTNFTGTHTLEHLQTTILMGVYQQNHGESDSYWASIGTAIKIAQNLGMSRLGNETDAQQYPFEWRSPIRREVARRVWWSLIFDDWSCAMAYQGAYSIHPSQNHTSFPANLDDVDLVETDPIHAKPLNLHTEMSSFICRLRLVEFCRQMVDESNYSGGHGHDFVLEVEAKIADVIGDIEEGFQVATGTRKQIGRPVDGMSTEKTLCQIMGQTWLLRLHRPFLVQGYRDPRHARSRDQSIKAAQLVLQLICRDSRTKELVRWPIGMLCGISAAVVLFIDLYHQRQSGADVEAEARRKELQNLLHLLRPMLPETTPIALNASSVLENLLFAEATSSKDLKQMGSGDSNIRFEEFVKRVFTDPSQGTLHVASRAATTGREPPITPLTPAQTAEQTMPVQFLPQSTLPSRILLPKNQDTFPGGTQLDEAPMTGLSDSYNFDSGYFFV